MDNKFQFHSAVPQAVQRITSIIMVTILLDLHLLCFIVSKMVKIIAPSSSSIKKPACTFQLHYKRTMHHFCIIFTKSNKKIDMFYRTLTNRGKISQSMIIIAKKMLKDRTITLEKILSKMSSNKSRLHYEIILYHYIICIHS